MNILNRTFGFYILLIGLTLFPIVTHAQLSDEEKAIAIASSHAEFVDFLESYDDWDAWAYEEDGAWVINFYVEDTDGEEEEWLGYAVIILETGEVYEAFAPKPLPTDVHSTLQDAVVKLVENDEEMQARLGDINQWELWVEYEPYERVWYATYYMGIEAWTAVVEFEFVEGTYDLEYMNIADIVDPNRFEEIEEIAHQKNEAIALAYEADGIDDALSDYDDWITLVSEHDNGEWAVQFIVGDHVVFFVLVDTDNWTILDTQ